MKTAKKKAKPACRVIWRKPKPRIPKVLLMAAVEVPETVAQGLRTSLFLRGVPLREWCHNLFAVRLENELAAGGSVEVRASAMVRAGGRCSRLVRAALDEGGEDNLEASWGILPTV